MFADVEERLKKMENEMRIAKDSWEKEKESMQTKLKVAESRDERIMQSCKTLFDEFQVSFFSSSNSDEVQTKLLMFRCFSGFEDQSLEEKHLLSMFL